MNPLQAMFEQLVIPTLTALPTVDLIEIRGLIVIALDAEIGKRKDVMDAIEATSIEEEV
jgi:hypothetical protein